MARFWKPRCPENEDPKDIAFGKVSPPREAEPFLKQLKTHVVGTTGK